MGALSGRTVFMSGGSRGIGLAIAKACAAQGANVAIAAKTAEPNPKLPGTVYTAAEEIEAAGGKALPLICDIRDEAQVLDAVEKTASAFGGIDIVVNNASAIQLTNTEMTEVKRYDLMTGINSRGTFVVTRSCLPHLKKSDHARILTLSPPLDFNPIWFRGHAAYSLAKYGMSILTMAWSEEFKGRIAANCLWPRTTIDTAAVRNLLGGEKMASESRTPQIMGDAAAAMLAKPVDFTGWCCLDDLVLAAEGVTDFDKYAVTPGARLQLDFFFPHDAPAPHEANGMVGWRWPHL
ncbi:SDR family oxidoreductase [Oceanicella actignis]|uniref:SDR family oxidoreductase n=1 Tax=Oceanicella actignis TaxID=1189325 RepID=UPI0011E6F172|nr:NAD(P)-dependent oxidoreductase [Oceanicella actignis]TYO90757.1 citronellol/citronellal dehydrogenase [Oceanicella actignis]